MVLNPEHPGTSKFGPVHRIRERQFIEREIKRHAEKDQCERQRQMRLLSPDSHVVSVLLFVLNANTPTSCKSSFLFTLASMGFC